MRAIMVLIIGSTALFGLAQEELKNLQIFPKDISRRELVNIMRGWAGDLGVRCMFCHYSPTGKFDDLEPESDRKETKKTARKMFKMMTELNESFFKDRDTKLSCYTCHHGTSDPRKLDDILAEALAEGGVAEVEKRYRDIREKYHGMGAYNFAAWAGLSTVAGSLGAEERYGEAKILHELNLEFNPDYDFSHYALGCHYLLVQVDKGKARDHFEKAMKGNSFWTPRRMLRLSEKFQKDGESDKVMALLQMVTEVAPDHADGHFHLGNALLESGDLEAARAAYQTALEKAPEHEGAKQALGEL